MELDEAMEAHPPMNELNFYWKRFIDKLLPAWLREEYRQEYIKKEFRNDMPSMVINGDSDPSDSTSGAGG